MRLFIKNNWIYVSVGLLLLVIIVIRAINHGKDINVYLYASQALFEGSNPYLFNPYNDYLYSPLFAILLGVVSFFQFAVGRVVWSVLNYGLTFRLFYLLFKLLFKDIPVHPRLKHWWIALTFFCSLGFLNHNYNLGQITIVVLWLMLEGIAQIFKRNNWKGALLIAFGINIKILPVVALCYLFVKRKFTVVFMSAAFVVAMFFLPSLYFGWEKNIDMHQSWWQQINPSSNKYVFEDNPGCQSLNAILPAYFLDFETDNDNNLLGLKRKVAIVAESNLKVVLYICQIALICSVLIFVLYSNRYQNWPALNIYREFSFLMLVTALVFPHQMKYAMLLSLPSLGYIIYHHLLVIRMFNQVSIQRKVVVLLTAPIILLLAVAGRDVIGKNAVKLLDFYHFMGLCNMLFLGLLVSISPKRIVELARLQ